MKVIKFVLVIIAFFSTYPAVANTTYYYSGNHLFNDEITGVPETTLSLSAKVTLDSSIPSNFTGTVDPSHIIGFSIAVNGFTYDSSNSNFQAQQNVFILNAGSVAGWDLHIIPKIPPNKDYGVYGVALDIETTNFGYGSTVYGPSMGKDNWSYINGAPKFDAAIFTNTNSPGTWSTQTSSSTSVGLGINGSSITMQLTAGANINKNADWWFVAMTPWGHWFYYIYPNRWVDIGTDLSRVSPAYQGPMIDISGLKLFDITGLQSGNYVFYFGVDTNMNGVLDYDQLVYSSFSWNAP